MIFFLGLGCASTRKAATPEATPPPAKSATEQTKPARPPELTEGQAEELASPTFGREAPPKPLPKSEPIDPAKVVHVTKPVLLNAEGLPLPDFIVYALGETLKVTFDIDESVVKMKDPITLRMTQEMPPAQVVEVVIGVLEKRGLVVEEKNGVLFISRSKPPARRPVDVRVGREVPDTAEEILQIVQLKYVRLPEIEPVIRETYKTGYTMRLYQRENALLISGPATVVKEVVDFITLLDVPYLSNRKMLMLKLTYWDTDEFVRQLSVILEGAGFSVTRSPRDAGVYFVPVRFLSSVLVITPDEASAKYVMDWYRKLDTYESVGAEEKAFTYIPKYSRASDLVDALSRIYTGTKATEGTLKSQPQTQSQQVIQQQQQQQLQSQVPYPTQYQTQAQAGVQAGQAGRAGSLLFSSLRMTSDDRRNIILISSSPAVYKSILTYLEKLDTPPRQVLIDATVAEFTLTDDFTFGVEWMMKNSYKNGTYTAQTLGNIGVSTSTGFVGQFLSNSQKFQAVVNAAATKGLVRILSNPRVMVIDNQEATIQVGTDVPVLTGQIAAAGITTSTGGATVLQNVQYQSTGIILKVKPLINTEGLLTLSLNLEVSEAQPNATSSVNSPAISTRKIATNIVAAHGESVMLGGLISENKQISDNKVPGLGDIPLLGYLFKNSSHTLNRTELVIILTPTVITNVEDAAKVTTEFREKLKWFLDSK
jgi:general secretion pathway protein D